MIEPANRSRNDACRFVNQRCTLPPDRLRRSVRWATIAVLCITANTVWIGSLSIATGDEPLPLVSEPAATIVRMAPKVLISVPLPISEGYQSDARASSRFVSSNQAGAETMFVEVMEDAMMEPMELDEPLLPPVAESFPPRASADAIGWLDIRPRNLDGDHPSLVSPDDLPEDASGLRTQSQIPHLIQPYASDLTLADFCRGATFCRHPLYFEDYRLERYGVIPGPLRRFPAIHSGIHFAWRAGALPANLAVDPPWESVPSGHGEKPLFQRFKSPF